MVSILISCYGLSMIITYVLNRLMLHIDRDWWYYPFGFLLFLTFVPGYNVAVAVILLIIACFANRPPRKRRYILDLYGIHGDDQQEVPY